MARSPFTLAASVTSAIPDAIVIGVSALSEGADGRFDSAVADLDDGRRVVIHVPVDLDAERDLLAGARALRALTPGVRALLPFRAPKLLGETTVDRARAYVVDYLPGYRLDAAHVPPGKGAATSLGAALAGLHSLPVSILRTENLSFHSPTQVHQNVTGIVDATDETGHVPLALIARWRRALGDDRLWRFESTVTLGGTAVSNFLFEDIDGIPTVTGALNWHGLGVGDPATDLHWLASAPRVGGDVSAAYAAARGRAPDALIRERARFYAELEFAQWLLHGQATRNSEIIDDAVDLLEALAKDVSGDDIVPREIRDTVDAFTILDSVPDHTRISTETSMQTDAYYPGELHRAAPETDADGSEGDGFDERTRRLTADQGETEPIDPVTFDDRNAATDR